MIPGQFLQISGALEQAGITGGSSGGGGGIEASTVVLSLVGIVFFAILAAFGAYIYIQKKKYKYKVIIFKRIDGEFRVAGRDKAKIENLSTIGDQIFKLKKNNKTLPMPSRQTGPDTYWYFISDDGEWINFGPGDFDQQRREMGADFLDKEMRYARTQLEQAADKKYNKESFLQKYGGVLASGAMLLLVGIAIYLIIDKVIEAMNKIPAMLEQAKAIQEQNKDLISSFNQLKSSGAIQNA